MWGLEKMFGGFVCPAWVWFLKLASFSFIKNYVCKSVNPKDPTPFLLQKTNARNFSKS